MFRVIIAGGRDFSDYELLSKTMDDYLSQIKDDISIVCGQARGADTLGEQYAKEHNHLVQYFPANWKSCRLYSQYRDGEECRRSRGFLERSKSWHKTHDCYRRTTRPERSCCGI